MLDRVFITVRRETQTVTHTDRHATVDTPTRDTDRKGRAHAQLQRHTQLTVQCKLTQLTCHRHVAARTTHTRKFSDDHSIDRTDTHDAIE